MSPYSKNLIFIFLLTASVLLKYCVPYGVYHRIKKGETLYSISKAYGVSLRELVEINNIKDPDKIREGQVIFIPGARTEKHPEVEYHERVEVRKPTTPSGITKTPTSATKSHKKATQKVEKVRSNIQFIWPVDGNVTSEFGIRNGVPHDGIDIAAPEGTPIKAAYDGKVIYSGDELKGYGNLIIIKHPGDYATVYAHNRINYVKEGDFVRKGQIIGEVGKTGRASAPHLHFEIRWKAKPQNPLLLLPSR